jgi:dihydrofolate synthase/folylpolyglutamate synthase
MNYPVFQPYTKKPRFFMPHYPIFTGNVKSTNSIKVKELLTKLGNPQHSLKNIIHVVGTNGKGSSCAFLKSILTEAGYKVAVYTSPHLYFVNERIEINDTKISDDKLYELTEKVRFLCEKEGVYLTIFESLTIVAVLFFAENDADFNIFEAGMGGENDATNIFEKVACVLLTSISKDHTRFLGESIAEIANQKLGILKEKTPVIMHPFSGIILPVVLSKVAEKKAIPVFFGRDYNFCKVEFEDGIFGIEFTGKKKIIVPIPPLLGEHQLYNLAGVLKVIEELNIDISEHYIINGILKTKWGGRLEKVEEKKLLTKLPIGSEIWFDGAHNEGGAISLVNWLKLQPKTFKNVLIVSKTQNSNILDFISPFKGIVDLGIALEGKGEIYPEFANIIEEGFIKVSINAKKAYSLNESLNLITFQDPVRIIMTGSLYLAREISFYLQEYT